MEAEISQQFSTEFPNIEFHEELFSFPKGWTDRAVLTDILQDVNVSQPATQNQISWLGKTGKR